MAGDSKDAASAPRNDVACSGSPGPIVAVWASNEPLLIRNVTGSPTPTVVVLRKNLKFSTPPAPAAPISTVLAGGSGVSSRLAVALARLTWAFTRPPAARADGTSALRPTTRAV